MRNFVHTALTAGILGTVALIVAQEVLVTRGPSTKPFGLGAEPSIGITATHRDSVCTILNTLLADEYVLYVKTQNYHWNVTGMSFNDLHLFFGKQYEQLATIVDNVAERVRALGGKTLGTMQDFIENARIKEISGTIPEAKDMLKNLLNDHESIIKNIRENIKETTDTFEDAGTNNFLSEILTQHEKMAWMLRSYVS